MPDFIRDAFPISYAEIVDARLADSFVEEACADFEHLSRTRAAACLGDRKMSEGVLADIDASLADLRAEIERRAAICTPTDTMSEGLTFDFEQSTEAMTVEIMAPVTQGNTDET